MKKKMILVLLGVAALTAGYFLRVEDERRIRTQVIADYLGMTRVMSSLMMEAAISVKVSPPSRYSLQVLQQQNNAFQKKYLPYRNMRLYEHNQLQDFLASVDATTKNFMRLARTSKTDHPQVWLQAVQGLDKLFRHNAVYCAMAVGRDKNSHPLSLRQKQSLLNIIQSVYGGILLEYAPRPSKPFFVNHLIVIKDSLSSGS